MAEGNLIRIDLLPTVPGVSVPGHTVVPGMLNGAAVQIRADQMDALARAGRPPSRAAAMAMTLDPALGEVEVQGYAAPGDGGRARYRYRGATEPDHVGKFYSGGWWEIAERQQHADMYGIARNGVGDVTAALNAARFAAYKTGSPILDIGPGVYSVSDTLYVGAGGPSTESTHQDCGLRGTGNAFLNSLNSSTVIRWVGATDADKAVVEVAGRISGVAVSGFFVDCDSKARDGVVVKSSYGGTVRDVGVARFRRDGFRVTTQDGATAQWYSSFNVFERCIAVTDHVERSGSYQTCAWNISGATAVAGAWGNTYICCRGQVMRDASGSGATPRSIRLGYTDSSTFIECDFTTSWSGVDGSGAIVPGTPGDFSKTGYGVVYDGTVKDQFPLNMIFNGCSIVGGELVIEDVGLEIGSIIHVVKTTRDNETASLHPRIRGYNDQGQFFGEVPLAVRGDDGRARLRFNQQNAQRWVDFVLNANAGAFTEFLALYRNSGGTEIPSFAILPSGELDVKQGLRSFRHTIADGAALSFTPPRSEGVLSLTRLGGVTQNALVAYDVVGTANCVAMATGGSANVVCTTGALNGDTGSPGSDGKLTVAAHTDGKIYIQNRTGGAITVLGTYLS